ncbi:MAG: Hsp20/alpha crystallin family protein [Gammaproteobacteria bacterium]|nr:MAG: Hsp20/alpha crystallin family protein [Gammaproteobacteria bacterium]
MGALDELRSGLSRTWDTLAEGWRQLVERASGALTRFVPHHEGEEALPAPLAHHAPVWGLLAAEVREDEENIVVRLEAPGMKDEDFDIRVEPNGLLVSGEKRYEREERKGSYHIMERAYGRFQRLIPLPHPVREEGATARYRRGVLEITLPKLKPHGRRRIEVKAD